MDPIQVPKLSTDRVLLSPLAAAHSQGVFHLWSHPDVCRHSGQVVDYDGNIIETPCSSQSQSDRILEFWVRAAHDGWGFRWSIHGKEAGSHTFMGMVGFNAISPIPEIAFHLHPRFWGKGYMWEATSAALEWATSNLRSDWFEAYIEDGNARSIRLATRLGFSATQRYKGRARQYMYVVTNVRDTGAD